MLNQFADIDNERLAVDLTVGGPWLGGDEEVQLVRLLDLFNSIGHNWRRSVLKLDDLRGTTLGYAILKTARYRPVKAYLRHVDASDASALVEGRAFNNFRHLASALEESPAIGPITWRTRVVLQVALPLPQWAQRR